MMINFLHDKNGWTEEEFRALSTEEKIQEVTSGFTITEFDDKSLALNSLKVALADTPKGRTIYLKYWISAAAVVAVGLISFLLLQPQKVTELMSQNGAVKEMTLPDGSKVLMNAGSKVSFSERKFDSNRRLSLTGEAFFEVKKGSSFVVETTHGQVKVLGTQFNVLSRNNEFRVECLSGRVGVESGSQYFEIEPGQQIKMEEGKLIKNELPEDKNIASWRNGEFNFDNEPIVSIFEELERQFDVTFELPDLKGRYYTGGFTNKNLEEALAQVCIPMELSYEIRSDRKIIITEKR